MSFILNNCMAISIVFTVIFFISIAFNKRIVALVLSFVLYYSVHFYFFTLLPK